MTAAFPPDGSRRRHGLITSGSLICLIAGVLNAQSSSAARTKMPDNNGVVFETKVEAWSKESAVVSYSVRNRRPNSIYAFNLLFHTDVQGNRTLDPQLAYVVPRADGGVVVGKFLIPIPAGMKVENVEMPYLDEILSDRTLAGRISLQFPLRPFDPFHDGSQITVNSNHKLLIQIGFLDSRRAARNEALIQPAHGTGAGHFLCDYGLGVRYQEFLQEEIEPPASSR